MTTTQTRRSLLKNSAKGALGLTTAALLGPLFLNACKKKPMTDAPQDRWEVTPCSDQDRLTEQDRGIRASLKYEDGSPIRHRTCDNCKLYTQALPKASCGGCRVVPGPIHPKGYCTAWLHRM